MANLFKKLFLASTVIGLSFIASTHAYAKDYYMSPIGKDTNQGTMTSPFASIAKAQSTASSGDTVYILGGTYKNFNIAATDANYNYVNEINKSGITYRALSSKSRPVFDFSNVPTNKRVAAFHIARGTSNVTFLAIDVTGVKVGNQKQSECFRVEGNATFNQVNAYNNEANGFYFTNHGTGSCIKCDSYNSIAPTATARGNTDGFGAHGDGVLFQYCRSWHNSDDGYDTISSTGSNTFEHCWAYDMTAGGDSNGFKIGGYGSGTVPSKVPVHTVKNCLSANNNAHGFYANHQPGQSATWTNNTAYNNKHGNFNMLERVNQTNAKDIPGTREVVHNNIAFTGIAIEESNLPSKNVSNNSWNKSGVSVSSADFQSLDASQMTKPRGADGVLPNITFMHLKSNSDLKGLGCF
ncbi:pectate lyase [Clostridium sp. SHJSY1]|uniref:right-handed parallel beta-helix repeat-containing protein n=1 Tax=Clostridium sp. SHJSY1 TaxID=2942483 RepID=UPI002874B2BF|nr:pectate lyase [Clostridium sp. SHJSY1]MDS0527993.1 pectate lyase [Clostridium sp. SHJSY1]